MPVAEIMPTEVLPPGMPFTDQVTEVLVEPVTRAFKVTTPPVCTVVAEGDRLTWIVAGDCEITTSAEPDFVGSCWLVAAIVTVLGTGTAPGEVYSPEPPIVPTVEFPPTMPLTDQVTPELVALESTAANFCVDPMNSEAMLGVTVTESCGGGTVITPPPPPPPLLLTVPLGPVTQLVSEKVRNKVSTKLAARRAETTRGSLARKVRRPNRWRWPMRSPEEGEHRLVL